MRVTKLGQISHAITCLLRTCVHTCCIRRTPSGPRPPNAAASCSTAALGAHTWGRARASSRARVAALLLPPLHLPRPRRAVCPSCARPAPRKLRRGARVISGAARGLRVGGRTTVCDRGATHVTRDGLICLRRLVDQRATLVAEDCACHVGHAARPTTSEPTYYYVESF